jgi:YVTN family beta-propeller protein
MKYLFPLLLLTACSPKPNGQLSSSTIAVTSDDKRIWVVNPDSDSVSLIDATSRTLVAEIPLGSTPALDAAGRYEPAIKPRALALSPDETKLYIAAETANQVFVVDTASRAVVTTISVGAAPVGVIATDNAIYVTSHEAATVSKIDPRSNTVVATLPVTEHPWGVSLSADGKRLFVSHLLVSAGVTVIDTGAFTVTASLALADQPAGSSKLVPNGTPRGVYSAVPRPSSDELWLPHMLLAVGTPQPSLDFESTVFPTITIAASDGSAERRRLLFKPLMVPGTDGAFTDSVSGPRALAFSPDGKIALLALAQSEDLMVFDGTTGNELTLLRPLPGTFLEGIAVNHAGTQAYVDGRNSHNVTVLKIAASVVSVDGDAIERLTADPMPADLRLGQRLFYSANSAAFPLTKNFWVACSTCHLEGGTDAVTWQFAQGPRDTPSNAGGPINTGFLFRQAVRNDVIQYDKTIRVEQGGAFDRTNAQQLPLLEALSAFVNRAIPFPQNPNIGQSPTAAQQRGATTFTQLCAGCHSGAYLTDSGAGNPTLDFTGTIVLHDIGTCVTTGQYVDKPSADEVTGAIHTACDFDTPSLRGIFATPPYFHDGSAATLADVVDRLAPTLSAGDKSDLVEYLRTL